MQRLVVVSITALVVASGISMLGQIAVAPAAQVEIAGYATSLKGRTASQRHNALLSARELDGAVIPPGRIFSFNHTVRTWSEDAGYVKAPVSYDGELVRAFGGGVCQTSTTLYNAALLAGLPIVERHPHFFAAHYIAPGCDAAVAQPGVDLRFRNPYRWPIRILACAEGDVLQVRFVGRQLPPADVSIQTQVLSASAPARLTREVERPASAGRVFVRSPGTAGCRVVTYRIFSESGREIRRERLSDDTYEAMNRVVQINTER